MANRNFIHLDFREQITAGVTRVYEVYSKDSGDYLGKIHWRTGWRCYVISYNDNIDFSVSCDDELNLFMHDLENERAKRLGIQKQEVLNLCQI